VPLIASPMPDVCNGEMAGALSKNGAIGIIHRFQTINEQVEQLKIAFELDPPIKYDPLRDKSDWRVGCAIGATGDYQQRLESLYENHCRIFCIDTANGANVRVENAVNWIKKTFQLDVHIIAGNVASREGFKYLADLGVDAIRVGIAGGCFTPNMIVRCANGFKSMFDIQIGDFVYSHDGTLNKVIDKLEFERDEEIFFINDVECTKNHEFYVLNKKYENVVTENNIESYAEWIPAEMLTDKYFLIKSS
jgi:hypothetical protein